MEVRFNMKLQEKIIDVTTGEETYRDYTPEEIAAVEAAKELVAQKAAVEAAKETARQAVLEKLGLTADDIAALSL